VHGALADGSGWRPVATILEHDGYSVYVVQELLTSWDADLEPFPDGSKIANIGWKPKPAEAVNRPARVEEIGSHSGTSETL